MLNNNANPYNLREGEVTLQAWPPVVQYALKKAKITELAVGSVGVFVIDAGEMLGAMLPKGAIKTVLVVYRYEENTWNFLNSKLELLGALREYPNCLMLYGTEMVLPRGRFTSNKFFERCDVKELENKLDKKFPKASRQYQAVK